MRDIHMHSVAAFFIAMSLALPAAAQADAQGTGKTMPAVVIASSLGQEPRNDGPPDLRPVQSPDQSEVTAGSAQTAHSDAGE